MFNNCSKWYTWGTAQNVRTLFWAEYGSLWTGATVHLAGKEFTCRRRQTGNWSSGGNSQHGWVCFIVFLKHSVSKQRLFPLCCFSFSGESRTEGHFVAHHATFQLGYNDWWCQVFILLSVRGVCWAKLQSQKPELRLCPLPLLHHWRRVLITNKLMF